MKKWGGMKAEKECRYEHDDNGRVIAFICFDDEKHVSSYRIEYSDTEYFGKQMIGACIYSCDEKDPRSIRYKYDEDGDIVSATYGGVEKKYCEDGKKG